MQLERVETTANRLKCAMSAMGKRQIDLVRELHIDKGAMSNYVHGKYDPKQDTMIMLARALDVSEMWLWGYNVPRERPKSQKENDLISDIDNKLKTNSDFFDTVAILYQLDDKKLASVKQMLLLITPSD